MARPIPLIALLSLVGASCALTPEPPAPPAAERELRAITQELLDAVAPGDVAVWDRYLDDALIHVDETGTVRTKAELLAELSPLPPGLEGDLRVDTFRMALHGDIAVIAHEDQEHLDYFGQTLQSRFRSLDTWRRTPEGWRLVAQQTAAVLKDPPAVALSREQLCAYAGVYRLTDEIETTIVCDDEGLLARREGRPDARYQAETADMFFVQGQPRTRRLFQRDGSGAVTGFVDRREGEDVAWRKIQTPSPPRREEGVPLDLPSFR
jgi:ketosteroid isomerase-like protein